MRKGVRDREEGGEGKERERKRKRRRREGEREKKLSHSTSYKSLTQLCLAYNMNMFSL